MESVRLTPMQALAPPQTPVNQTLQAVQTLSLATLVALILRICVMRRLVNLASRSVFGVVHSPTATWCCMLLK